MNFDGDSDETLDGWSRDIETILDNLLDNVNKLQEQHRQRYLQSQSLLIFFRIPLIILSIKLHVMIMELIFEPSGTRVFKKDTSTVEIVAGYTPTANPMILRKLLFKIDTLGVLLVVAYPIQFEG